MFRGEVCSIPLKITEFVVVEVGHYSINGLVSNSLVCNSLFC